MRCGVLTSCPVGGRSYVLEAAEQIAFQLVSDIVSIVVVTRAVDVPTASVSVIDYPDGFSAHAFAAGECGAPIVQAVGVKPKVTPADAPKLGDVRGKPLE